jgi:hypothetical protein
MSRISSVREFAGADFAQSFPSERLVVDAVEFRLIFEDDAPDTTATFVDVFDVGLD